MMGYDDDEDFENDDGHEEIVAAVNGNGQHLLTEEELKLQIYAQAQLQMQMQQMQMVDPIVMQQQ